MRRLNLQRFVLALASIAGLIAAGVGVFLLLSWGKELTAVAVGLLTLLIREIGGGKAAAFGWFFDGSADKSNPAPGTSSISTTVVDDPALKTSDDSSTALKGTT